MNRDEVLAICLNLPAAEETYPFGEQVAVVEQLTELVAVEKKIKTLTRQLRAMVIARGSTLMDLPGVGPVVAARILADVGDVARFADRTRFASGPAPHPWTPPPASRSRTGCREPATGR